jgi:LysM repeat protein
MKKVLTIIVMVAALQLAVVSATYAAPPAWGGGGAYHHVMYGETLSSIGRMYNAAPHCIADANGLWDPNVIYAGTVLFVPASCPPYPAYGHPGNPGWTPINAPCYGGSWQHCNVNCTVNCSGGGYYPPSHPPVATPYYGYDYTGYYYGHGHNQYSHTCGYYNNCW